MQFYSITDCGKRRPSNEDCCIAKQIGDFTVLILADGMGGHQGGEVASCNAIDAVIRHLEEKLASKLIPAQIFSILDCALEKANEKLYSLSLSDSSLEGMGTTIDVCIIKDSNAYISHIGDSRVYKISSDAVLSRLTKDHSLMEYMIEQGAITPEEAQHHPQKNVITRALGTSPEIQADTLREKLKKGDRLLLCSDGLSNMLTEDTICAVVAESSSVEAAAKELIKRANEAGGDDNITVIVAQY